MGSSLPSAGARSPLRLHCLLSTSRPGRDVDFSEIGKGAVQVSDDRRSATITLPQPQISKARIDPTRSYV